MFSHRRFYQAWRKRVDANSLAGIFDRSGLRQPDDPMFRGDLSADARVRDHSRDRRVVNDSAATVLQHQLDLVFHAKKYSL